MADIFWINHQPKNTEDSGLGRLDSGTLVARPPIGYKAYEKTVCLTRNRNVNDSIFKSKRSLGIVPPELSFLVLAHADLSCERPEETIMVLPINHSVPTKSHSMDDEQTPRISRLYRRCNDLFEFKTAIANIPSLDWRAIV